MVQKKQCPQKWCGADAYQEEGYSIVWRCENNHLFFEKPEDEEAIDNDEEE